MINIVPSPMKKIALLFCVFLCHVAVAQQKINTMFYNLYRFPDNPPAHREQILKNILDEYHPDLLMTCELVREEGANRILNTSLQTSQFNFARAAFTPTQINFSDPLQQMVFYNMDRLILIRQKILPTQVREINHYTFILNTTDLNTDSVFLEVFVTHLKSSDGTANQLARLHMVDTFAKALESIPQNHHVLLAGDFNLYSAYDEPAYQKILDPSNAIKMVDPIDKPGNWSDNDTFKDIHTQATRISSTGFGTGGATGGLDDRFDFIMMSENLRNAADLSYVPGSYKAFGNNGNCFNERIDHYDCEGVYSLPLRQNLYNMSDHLPVVMQLQTNKQWLAITEPDIKNPVSLPAGNIAGEFLSVKIDASLLHGSTLRIYNNLGQTIHTLFTIGKSNPIAIYTGDMPAGMYYLSVTGKVHTTLKFLKQ
jgi:endonuclease/exonuclease/phosphatase family metal-dependent hydrolase